MPTARINGHSMYYEVLGQGEPVPCAGGSRTFCHEYRGQLARGLADPPPEGAEDPHRGLPVRMAWHASSRVAAA